MNKNSHTTAPAIDANTVLTPVFTLCLRVKYELSNEFVQKVNSEGCKIEKVIELLNCKMLEYWINCSKEKEELITNFAFMTWIKNPVFQKYYHGSKAFEDISQQYINERLSKENE
jgi:hypothetical protein